MTVQYAQMFSPHGGGALEPTMIIVHAMAEFIDTNAQDYYAPEWLEKLGLSAHVLVTPSGVAIQGRDFELEAWHAKDHNDKALGIELLVPGLHTYETFIRAISVPNWPAEPQYLVAIAVIREWIEKYNIPRSDVQRHSDVSPGRKVDPGSGFPWDLFREELAVVDAEM